MHKFCLFLTLLMTSFVWAQAEIELILRPITPPITDSTTIIIQTAPGQLEIFKESYNGGERGGGEPCEVDFRNYSKAIEIDLGNTNSFLHNQLSSEEKIALDFVLPKVEILSTDRVYLDNENKVTEKLAVRPLHIDKKLVVLGCLRWEEVKLEKGAQANDYFKIFVLHELMALAGLPDENLETSINTWLKSLEDGENLKLRIKRQLQNDRIQWEKMIDLINSKKELIEMSAAFDRCERGDDCLVLETLLLKTKDELTNAINDTVQNFSKINLNGMNSDVKTTFKVYENTRFEISKSLLKSINRIFTQLNLKSMIELNRSLSPLYLRSQSLESRLSEYPLHSL